MRIALAQINPVLGDFKANRLKISEFIQRALMQGCDLVLFPELTLMGYLPNDLLERESIIDEQLKEFSILKKHLPAGIAVLVGLMTKSGVRIGKPYYNSAALLQKGKEPQFFHKELLPTYDVFDEARHIEKGAIKDHFFKFKGRRILLTICEDIWGWDLPGHAPNYLENPLVKLRREKVDLVLNMSASPFTIAKEKDRRSVVAKTAQLFKAPMAYVNMIGGQDEIVFDGGSFAVNAKGQTVLQCLHFEEDFCIFDLEEPLALKKRPALSEAKKNALNATEKIRRALVLGIKDYVRKTGFEKVHLGLSGGIDSAVVACLAVEALGPENVTVFTLPGPYNEERSRKLAEAQAANLGIRCLNLSIDESYEVLLRSLKVALGDFEFSAVNENLQSRLRGLMLMAFSNKEKSMLLTTGNKCEYATGYATLYGDMCGGLAPIADLLKGQVYALADCYNQERTVIPVDVITRPPSAELLPNQRDQDSLPPYADLDESVRRIVELRKPARTATDRWLLGILSRTEFKRWQAAPIIKISGHAFGRGRRMPIAQRTCV